MNIKIKFNTIGVSIIISLIVTQIVFLILRFSGAIDWNIVFVILPIIVLVSYMLIVILIFYIHYLIVTKDERRYIKDMNKVEKILRTPSRNNVIIPEILAYQASQITDEEDVFNEHQ